MKKFIYMAAVATAMALTGCNDFLDREPLDFGDENSYYNTAEDLKIAANTFYSYLPQNAAFWGGIYTEDTNSDNQISTSYNTMFYLGEKRTVDIESSEWNFSKLREINFFINKVEGKYDEISGNQVMIDHYLAEGYFFRAYEYFRLLTNFGDVPLLTEMQVDDRDQLTANSKRYPRNEVARFILADLDKALTLVCDNAPESGRIGRDAVLAFKSRVALYEGTWEKYHAGTCFVPGNSKWPGAAYWPDFQFKAGSAEAEINFFLEEAYKAAEQVVENHPLAANIDDLMGLFNAVTTDFGNNSEVILARYYLSGVMTHSCSALLRNGGGCGVTRAAVNTFLMQDGKPIYAASEAMPYQGDRTSYAEFQNRDPRLTNAVRAAGFITGSSARDTVYYYRPYIFNNGREKSTTGYELQKWYNESTDQVLQYGCTTAVPLIRTGEVMLNYIEAYYERHGNLGGKCDQYWKALRRRAGISEDYKATIAATDLAQENDFAVTSRGQMVDNTLYNIRRERRCELLAEGFRLNDLKRWRALDLMKDYQPEGFNLWEQMYKMYSSSQISAEIVSQKGVSTYMRPLQINSTSVVYNGYTFPKQHYTEPIPVSEFLLTGDVMYQNPGWPRTGGGIADYTYDCD